MEFKDIKDNSYSLFYESSSIKCDCNLGTIESDACGLFGKFTKENFRAEKIFNIFIEKNFQTVLDIGAGKLEATEKFIENGTIKKGMQRNELMHHRLASRKAQRV